MEPLFDTRAPKKPANLTVNSDLLQRARALKINLSAVLEKALNEQLAQQAGTQWLEQNRKAVRAYNAFIEENGGFGDDDRDF